jgi:hypothetical protein
MPKTVDSKSSAAPLAADDSAILSEDADLRAIVESWSDLPQTIKTAILALIQVGEES